MVDVGAKPDTERLAIARGEVHLRPETVTLIRQGLMKKGDVLTVAQDRRDHGRQKDLRIDPAVPPAPADPGGGRTGALG